MDTQEMEQLKKLAETKRKELIENNRTTANAMLMRMLNKNTSSLDSEISGISTGVDLYE